MPFKLRNTTTGLFCKGEPTTFINNDYYWNAKGKTYLHKGSLTRHLNFYKKHAFNDGPLPDNWEVVEYEMTEVSTKSLDGF